MPYNLLSEPIRRYIREKRWEQLRPIQAAAIPRILQTDSNYILASRTASGKTEAAFLPILSCVDFNETGIQVLYISPLIALINDQLTRIEDLCKYIDVPVTKWHGEASQSAKNRILKEPRGIMLITPESLEAMFVTKPYNVTHLFSNLKFVIIDEIHSFIGTDRGIQLKSILSRLQEKNNNQFRIIGLSATIGDYEEAKRFTGNEANTKILVDRGTKPMLTEFRYFAAEEQTELPLELMKDMYKHVHDNKTLIFPNSRGRVEEIAVKLKKISERVGGHGNFFAHHSSVNKEVREYVEFFAKNSIRENFSIACTSTLELGIDIGSVDEVIQVDATHSISSLIQRVGRSGRKDDSCSKLMLYATNPWYMLQSLACWNLHRKGYIEPPDVVTRPYDILGHQALSIIKGHSGIDYKTLIGKLSSNFAFDNILKEEIVEIVNHFIQLDFVERLGNELIIGIEGEKIVNSRDFYSTFEREINLKVIHNSRVIGDLPFSPQIQPDSNILLAARIWKIEEVDLKSGKIYVTPAKDGKKPTFSGGGVNVHSSIHQEMFGILISNEEFEILDEDSNQALKDLRKIFSGTGIKDSLSERPVMSHDMRSTICIFSGSKTTAALRYLLSQVEISSLVADNSCSLEIATLDKATLSEKWSSLLSMQDEVDLILSHSLEEAPQLIHFSKWGKYLPEKYKVSLIRQKLYDFEGAFDFIRNYTLIYSKE